ncbi:hypothetical protein G4B88_003653 [Cannabis sativa]|uniref:ATP-dependent RNA helicase n=1 Tax=Cannabis sativa TaxID=3483 RepID=A0A7J6F144_CANSA|nr:hypothetical protein G4B88_003653 [Cannabis sativa]
MEVDPVEIATSDNQANVGIRIAGVLEVVFDEIGAVNQGAPWLGYAPVAKEILDGESDKYVGDDLRQEARHWFRTKRPEFTAWLAEVKQKQTRLLKWRPEIVVGALGRLRELMSGGDKHLLHSLSFFVLDEADRMIENGHLHELQSIIDMLPMTSGSAEVNPYTKLCYSFKLPDS